MLGFFGELLDIPQWAMMLSPFYHIPQLSLDDMRILPLLVLTAVSFALTLCGLVFYRQRDMIV